MAKTAIDIVDYIETFHQVSCQAVKCRKGEMGMHSDDVEFAKDLWAKGWRISKMGTLYCPDCSKKRLKSSSTTENIK